MKFLRRVFPWLAVVLLLVMIRFMGPEIGRSGKRTQSNETKVHPPAAIADRASAESGDSNHTVTTDPRITRLIEQSCERLLHSKDADESAVIVRELKDEIRSAANERTAAEAMRRFLESGGDAATKMAFVVGEDGTLESAPTLRSILLDLLGSVDPDTALTASREIMDRKSSPDEYAVALRNLAWNDLDGDLREELARRFTGMLETKDWLARPSAGFLEALDAAVELSDTKAFNALILANRDAVPSFTRAAFIAMDRMVLRKPSLLVNAFHNDPALHGLSPDLRASLMSRLDLTEPAQRDVFLGYLSAPEHGPRELDYFAGLFPNGNQLQGNRLITGGETPVSIDERKRMDRATLEELDRMAEATGAGPARDVIIRIRGRLKRLLDGAP